MRFHELQTEEPLLQDCPFCGGKAGFTFAKAPYVIKKFQDRYIAAGCKSCGVATPIFYADNHTRSPMQYNKAYAEEYCNAHPFL